MKNNEYDVIKHKQKILNERHLSVFLLNLIIILLIILFDMVVGVSGNNNNEGDYKTTYESKDHIVVISPANAPEDKVKKEIMLVFCENFTENEKQEIIKIATAEVEGK